MSKKSDLTLETLLSTMTWGVHTQPGFFVVSFGLTAD